MPYKHVDGSVWPEKGKPIPPPPQWVLDQMSANAAARRLTAREERKTLSDVPPDVWLSKPRRKGEQPVEVPIADLPLMQLVNIIKRLVREARSKGQLTQSPIETLAHMAEYEMPQLYALAVEANKRSLLVWPTEYHEAFVAALTVLRLGRGRR